MSSPGFSLFSTPQAGNNQYGAFGTGMPGVVPGASGGDVGNLLGTQGTSGGLFKQSNGISTLAPIAPNLTTDFMNYLKSQIGSGATPFNLSTVLPSTGAATAPGQLNAPVTPILQQLSNFYTGGASSIPGSDTLSQMAQTGMPVTALPAWQAAVAAQQQNIQRQQAALREQFAFSGSLASSPFGDAMQNYLAQTTADQNATLAQAQQQALEAAAGRQLTASTDINQGAAQLGQLFQGMDQQAIQNMLQEFIRTRPEYSPLLNTLFGAATTFPPSVQTGSGSGGLGALLGGIGSIAGAIPGIGSLIKSIPGLSGGGGSSGSAGMSIGGG